jgi:hypothetical protein
LPCERALDGAGLDHVQRHRQADEFLDVAAQELARPAFPRHLDLVMRRKAGQRRICSSICVGNTLSGALSRVASPTVVGPHNEGAPIDAAFLDPPYNVRISGHANAKGRTASSQMASGEMTDEAFRGFLSETLGAAARVSRDGAVHFICMAPHG